MSNTVIKVEDLGKLYKLGEISTGTLSHDLNRWWARMRGKEDPFAKIGEANDRTIKGNSEYVWALKDINFEVKQGEVLGIIGRNGAGKSTLLKILSKVTTQTTGRIKIKGRIASLLEVGTGFHPELTGRENIYLNGAILGMSKAEIRSKFDEIVDFSGVERYIDTPVKRYSSGMYVRLAFSVAAFLEPEILIVDEVLAVGDAEFQKKCLGRMKDVSSNDGRTILFVSHNLNVIKSLCRECLYLKNGRFLSYGSSEDVVYHYMNDGKTDKSQVISWDKANAAPGDEVIKMKSVRIIDRKHQVNPYYTIAETIGIEINYEVLKEGYVPIPNLHVTDRYGEYVFIALSESNPLLSNPGEHTVVAWIPPNLLNVEYYNVGVALCTYTNPMIVHYFERNLLSFETLEDMNERGNDFKSKYYGQVRPKLDWELS